MGELSLNLLERLKIRINGNISHFESLQQYFVDNNKSHIAEHLSAIITGNREELAMIETLILTHSEYKNEHY